MLNLKAYLIICFLGCMLFIAQGHPKELEAISDDINKQIEAIRNTISQPFVYGNYKTDSVVTKEIMEEINTKITKH